jgi:hypothetical protein
MDTIKTSPNGRRICESHGRAKTNQQDVDLMRDLNEEGMGYDRLSTIFPLHRATIQHICTYRIWVTAVY